MFGRSRLQLSYEMITKVVTEAEILYHYLGISKIPCLINSPLRRDSKPSFGFFSKDGIHIAYNDFAEQKGGSLFSFFTRYWQCSYYQVMEKIYSDLILINYDSTPAKKRKKTSISKSSDTTISVKVRAWQSHDKEYWEQYGITKEWLMWAEVYPISHIIWKKKGKITTTTADKYAYVYVEHKEGNTTFKIYQPFNTNGFKWISKHDKSVVSLWTKVPESGDRLFICSSVKDALCLSANCGYPAIALQGEGYKLSKTAIKVLKQRYKHIYILFDGDAPGLKDGEELSKETGFQNIPMTLNWYWPGKDLSDYRKYIGEKGFRKYINKLLSDNGITNGEEVPKSLS